MLKNLLHRLTYTPAPLRLYSFGKTDAGLKRKRNEDNVFIDEKLRLFMVADGMGGHQDGDVASKLTGEIIRAEIEKLSLANGEHSHRRSVKAVPALLQHAVEEANNLIYGDNQLQGLNEGKGMGSTVSGLWIGPSDNEWQSQLYLFNVGDSRIYRYSNNTLEQLTTDHTHYQLWLDRGQEGPEPGHNSIYKAIGPWRRVIAEQKNYPITQNTLYLLCSDGLSSMLGNDSISKILSHYRHESLETRVEQLISAANKAGGKDNISAILVSPDFFL